MHSALTVRAVYLQMYFSGSGLCGALKRTYQSHISCNFVTLQILFGPVVNRMALGPNQIFGKSLKFGTYGR